MTTNKGGVGARVVRDDSTDLPSWNVPAHAPPFGVCSQHASASFPTKINVLGKDDMRENPRTSSSRTRVARAVLTALLLAAPLTADAQHSIAGDEGFAPRPTCKTTGNGAFNNPTIWSCGRVPGGADWVQIDHAVTLSSSVTIWTLYVSPAGSLTNVGTGFTITISDTAPADAPQFDTGIIVEGAITLLGRPKTAWTTTTAGLATGASSVTVNDCDNWLTGDRLVFGDSREPIAYVNEPEVRTITALSGCTITLDRPLGHPYTTGRDHDGVVERLIPVGNLTRDITIRSANPLGRRGHLMFTGMAKVDVQYVSVLDMGRTTIAPLNDVTNHIGRYAFHFHHLMTRGTATAVGVVVERYTKWGYTVHASNGNTLRNTIAYDGQGAGYMTETGTEADNVFDRNLCILVSGGKQFNAGMGHPGGSGADGTCFWMHGPRNILTSNVAMNGEQSGFALWETLLPPRALNVFLDNESIANTYGLSLWTLGSESDQSLIDHFMEWHNTANGLYDYGSRNLVFKNFYSRSDPSYSVAAGTRGIGKNNWFGDYDTGFVTVFDHPNIQNKDTGLYLPYGNATQTAGPGERVVTITDGYFYNTIDLFVMMQNLSGGAQPVRTEVIRPIHGNATGTHYEKRFHGGGNLTLANRLRVTDYQGVAGVSFEVYSDAQAPGFPMPQTASGVTGCPSAGMTNQQCRDAHGVSIYGEMTPAAAVPRARVAGKVLPIAVGRGLTTLTTRTVPHPPTPEPKRASASKGSPIPTIGDGVQSQADYSALPVCAMLGPAATDQAGRHWTIGENFKLLTDGVWDGGSRGFVYITTPDGLFVIGTNGRLYQMFGPGSAVSKFQGSLGCRLPPSASGATMLQQNGYLVDNLGGVWVATCSYYIFATYCPDFIGTTIEPGIIVRNGVRLGTGLLDGAGRVIEMGGVRSMPEPNNAPWNLKWCGGEMYMHVWNADTPVVHAYARWQGPDTYDWAPALETDCGSETPATNVSPPSNVRIVADK